MGRNPGGEKQKLRKGLWSPEEDEKLFKHINTYGVGCWSSVAKEAGLQRCGKSCRLRWINYLRPGIKRGSFSEEEENLVISLHKILGNRWSQIASHLPRRTDNEIKNLWNSTIKKKLAKTQGLADSNLPRPLGSYSKSVVNPTDTDTGSSSVQGDNVSCSTSAAAAATGGGNVAVSGSGENYFSKSGMEDFLQLIHNNCTGIDQEQDLASMMSGEGLDREYEVGFF